MQISGSSDAAGQVGAAGRSFAALFWEVFRALGYALPNESARDLCFSFELMTRHNRVIIPHPAPRLVLIGARPQQVLERIAASLRPDGVFLMQDIAGTSRLEEDVRHPAAPFLYTISCMHCMSVSLAHGGPGLGAMWGRETAAAMLRQAGFTRIRVESLPHDVMNFYYVATIAD